MRNSKKMRTLNYEWNKINCAELKHSMATRIENLLSLQTAVPVFLGLLVNYDGLAIICARAQFKFFITNIIV